jgi:hypothetical protein
MSRYALYATINGTIGDGYGEQTAVHVTTAEHGSGVSIQPVDRGIPIIDETKLCSKTI